jgi:hypothetical protein
MVVVNSSSRVSNHPFIGFSDHPLPLLRLRLRRVRRGVFVWFNDHPLPLLERRGVFVWFNDHPLPLLERRGVLRTTPCLCLIRRGVFV